MRPPRAGIHTKRSALTSQYDRDEFQTYLWKHLLSDRLNRLKTYSCDTYLFCWNIIIICSIVPGNQNPSCPPDCVGQAFSIPPPNPNGQHYYINCTKHLQQFARPGPVRRPPRIVALLALPGLICTLVGPFFRKLAFHKLLYNVINFVQHVITFL